MLHRLSIVFVFLSLASPTNTSAQTYDADTLKLLNEVTQKYATATRSHIESVSDTRQSAELFSTWRKELTSAYEAPGNRYRFGGRNSSGSGLVISDGTTEWELHETYGEYVKRPAGTFGNPFPNTITFAEGPKERDAFFMRRNLGLLSHSLKAAHWHPDETVLIGDRKIDCLVVSFGLQDFSTYDPNGSTYEKRIWIDKARMLIVKTEQISDGRAGGALHGDPQRAVETVVYPVVSLNEPIPDEAFAFTPPADAKLVDKFTDPFARYAPRAAAATLPAPSPPPDYIGKPAPKLILTAADGSSIDLASLKGKPVLIDLWATWCGPCLIEMPTIDRIFRYAKPLGLVVLGIDQDKDPEDALAYLKKENYVWANYHDGKDGKYNGVGLAASGMPTLLLISADGKIAFYHVGATDEAGLVAAVRRLGPAFAAAMDQAEK